MLTIEVVRACRYIRMARRDDAVQESEQRTIQPTPTSLRKSTC